VHQVVGWREGPFVVELEHLFRREGSGEGKRREVLAGDWGYIAAWHKPCLPPLVQKIECPQECGSVWEKSWKLFVVTEYRQAGGYGKKISGPFREK
jgi:hypothetical protein